MELHNWIMESYNFVASSPLPPLATDQNKNDKLHLAEISPHDFYFFAFLSNVYKFSLLLLLVFLLLPFLLSFLYYFSQFGGVSSIICRV